MIHHETESARTASDGGGEGHFNVVETSDGFMVLDQDRVHSEHTSMRAAMKAAKAAARGYDRNAVEQAMRRFARNNPLRPGTPRRITGLGAYEGQWVVFSGEGTLLDGRDQRMAMFQTARAAEAAYHARARIRAERIAVYAEGLLL